MSTSSAAPLTAILVDRIPPQMPSDGMMALSRAFLGPVELGDELFQLATSPEMQTYAIAEAERALNDWPNLSRYWAENKALSERPHVIFMGDSITENWAIADPAFFNGRVLSRGISGQTTPQMLLRFTNDVIALRPEIVHILAGTNDIAGNTGPTTLEDVMNNIAVMVQLAKANGIKVVLGSVLPATFFYWKPGYQPAAMIVTFNQALRAYALAHHLTYVDYYATLSDSNGGLKKGYANDGVHPNRSGYAVMKAVAEAAIVAI